MKLSCLQENLANGLSVVSRAVATRTTLPVLSNILLSTDQSRLKLSATDLELGINCWVGAQVEEEGAVTVPARLLSDFVNSLPPGSMDLELVPRTQTLNLKSDRFEANIKGINAEEFPPVQVSDEDDSVSMAPDLLRRMVEQVAFAAATDESRPVLTGVLVKIADDKLTFAAADGYRLSVSSTPLEREEKGEMLLIVPARALQELRRVSAEQEEPIEMIVSSDRNQVFFKLENVHIVSQLVEGTFPDYEQIIPSDHSTRVVVGTAEFLRALRMAFIFAQDAANIVRFQVVRNDSADAGRLIISATSAEHGDNVSELDVHVEGEPIEIAFNVRYCIDALGVMDTAQVSLETSDPSSPGVLKPVGGEDFVHIIMPMHISS
ncbi:MAG: DNA polymerase III subunit beta [Chloroflexota bacterium]|nr:DNA polymerase III subunit beta [Chloroflexota bacterium]